MKIVHLNGKLKYAYTTFINAVTNIVWDEFIEIIRSYSSFFTSIDDQVWSIPTIKAILPLVDNYYSNVKIMEDNTYEEQLEESYFLSKVMETRVMKKAYQFCLDKGNVLA